MWACVSHGVVVVVVVVMEVKGEDRIGLSRGLWLAVTFVSRELR